MNYSLFINIIDINKTSGLILHTDLLALRWHSSSACTNLSVWLNWKEKHNKIKHAKRSACILISLYIIYHKMVSIWLSSLRDQSVPGNAGNLVVKIELSPWSRSAALRQVNPIHHWTKMKFSTKDFFSKCD